jgi:hypothetical protein
MRLMMKNRQLNNIFELLENERKRSIDIFDKLYLDGLEPTIIWKINSDDPGNGYYKESEAFQFEKLDLIMINYYDANKDVYNLALKLIDINKNDENNNNPDDNMQYIVSILSICEIKEINYKSKINFNCVFSNTKTKVLVFKIENFSKLFKNFENIQYSMTIYFNISFNFSAILTHICKNFYEFHSLNSISKIPKNVLSIILKNKFLNVRSEDEVLQAILTWSKKLYFNLVNNRQNVSNDTIEDLIKHINWHQISLDSLLDFILAESKLLLNSSELQTVVIEEFSRRFKEEYCNSERKLHTIVSSRNQTQSFTTDLILKLISN